MLKLAAKAKYFLSLPLALSLVGIQLCAFAQTGLTPITNSNFPTPGTTPVPDGAQTKPAAKLENHPSWRELDADQKVALAPLQQLWSRMSDFQKQKWLVISKNYMSMGPDEQARLQSRMNDWVSLSNQERSVARLNFAEVNKLSEDQKRVKWEAYQALEPDAKQKLLDSTQPLPKGAAIAVKPTNKALLTITPGTPLNTSSTYLPRIDVSQISPKTLLVTSKTASLDKSAGPIVK